MGKVLRVPLGMDAGIRFPADSARHGRVVRCARADAGDQQAFAFRKLDMLTCQADPKMRQLHLVITAGLLCHLFPGAVQVTSQALPAGGEDQTVQSGCRVELTAPPGAPAATASPSPAPNNETAPAKTPKIVISPEQPVVINAGECE